MNSQALKFTKKQMEVFKFAIQKDPQILILAGGKRAGKTFILNYLFLLHIAKFKNQGLNFIIGGTTQASIRRNVLSDMEKILGKELKLRKDNSVGIFGNRVYILEGGKADSFKRARGFTSYGFLGNESTTLHDKFVKECISRCSGNGARIMMDTNPENPMSTVKTDYIDKDGDLLDDGRLNIKYFHFTLYDNEFLSKEYIDSIVKSTPSGVYFDRDILGLWVNAEGLIYDMWDKDKNVIKKDDFDKVKITKYWGAVDWGYGHYGVLCIFAKGADGKTYLVEEHAYQKKNVEKFWIPLAKEMQKKYGDILFYCDSARVEHIDSFNENGIRAIYAEKAVVAGISHVASMIHTRDFLVVEGVAPQWEKEVNLYCWQDGKDAPLKTNDDAADCIRYGLYTEHILYEKIERKYGKR